MIKILSDLGPVSEKLQGMIQDIEDADLKEWVKLASRAEETCKNFWII